MAMHDAVIGALRPLSQTQEDPPYKPLLVDANPPRYSPEVLAASAGAEILKTLFTIPARRAQIDAVLEDIVGAGGSPRSGAQAAIDGGKSIAHQILAARREMTCRRSHSPKGIASQESLIEVGDHNMQP